MVSASAGGQNAETGSSQLAANDITANHQGELELHPNDFGWQQVHADHQWPLPGWLGTPEGSAKALSVYAPQAQASTSEQVSVHEYLPTPYETPPSVSGMPNDIISPTQADYSYDQDHMASESGDWPDQNGLGPILHHGFQDPVTGNDWPLSNPVDLPRAGGRVWAPSGLDPPSALPDIGEPDNSSRGRSVAELISYWSAREAEGMKLETKGRLVANKARAELRKARAKLQTLSRS